MQTVHFSEEAQYTGLNWIDGSKIYRITQAINAAAGTVTNGEAVANLNTLISVVGFEVLSSGAIYPLGFQGSNGDIKIWKDANANYISVLTQETATIYATLYYSASATATPEVPEVFDFFDNGYTNDADSQQIGWSANLLTRPSGGVDGYTVNGIARLDRVETDGYMYCYISTGSNFYYNAHVCTTNLIHIPTNALKLTVRAARTVNSCQMKIALLPADAPNSMDTSNGGVISTYFTLTNAQADYSIDVPANMRNTDLYRIVVNIRGYGDAYRQANFYKVKFE